MPGSINEKAKTINYLHENQNFGVKFALSITIKNHQSC